MCLEIAAQIALFTGRLLDLHRECDENERKKIALTYVCMSGTSLTITQKSSELTCIM